MAMKTTSAAEITRALEDLRKARTAHERSPNRDRENAVTEYQQALDDLLDQYRKN